MPVDRKPQAKEISPIYVETDKLLAQQTKHTIYFIFRIFFLYNDP